MELDLYLDKKGREYAPFDPSRAKVIYEKLKPYLPCLPLYKIHILGTNAKGSTGRYLAQGFFQNKKTFLHFTSPHLFNFRERFYKNGSIILQEELENAHQFLQQFLFINDSSYFEYATFLAFVLSSDVDYLIMEAGLGGEFDSTSCIDYEMSIFTPISLDHQEFLGNSIQEIATTKLRAMSGDTFLANQTKKEVIEIAKKEARRKNINLQILQSNSNSKKNESDFLQDNLFTAQEILKFLNLQPLQTNQLDQLRGRFEKITENITIDVGHNIDAAKAVKKNLGSKKVILIYNSYKDKDIFEILKTLQQNIIKVLIFPVLNSRIIEKEKLCKILISLQIPYEDFSCIQKNEEYLVFGSFSLVQAFLEYESRCAK